MGLLITGYFLIYGVMQLPAGVLADILGPRKSILWFTALTCIGSLLFWLSYRYELLLAAQVIIGVGTSVFYVNAVTLVTRWFPPEKKATAIGVLSASMGIGGFASYMGFPISISLWGSWRLLYLGMLVVLLANWVINILILRDSPQPVAFVKREKRGIIGSFKDTLADKHFQPMLFTYTFLAFNYVLYSWGSQFFVEAKKLIYVEAGVVTSLGTIASFLGALFIGMISDRLRKKKAPLIFFYGIYLISLITLILTPAGLPIIIYAGLWALMGIGTSSGFLFFSMVGEVLPARKMNIGLGLLNGLSIIFSSSMTPIYGSIVDQTGSFFIPNLISIGFAALTFTVLLLGTRETYGNIVKD
jgi:MFS family permease